MRKIDFRRALTVGTLAAGMAVCAMGPGKPDKPLKKNVPAPKAEETLGDLAKVPPMSPTRVEGVGLVVGLDNTGSDPPPSGYRNKLLDRMRKANVHDAEKILASGTTSLVLIEGQIPAGITSQDVFDVELKLTFDSKTTSLAGGGLIMTDLHQVGFGKDGEAIDREGQNLATVYGPVVPGSMANPNDLKIGRVLGGARVKKDQPYALVINEKRQSYATAQLLMNVINSRFNRLKGIEQVGMANSVKSDKYLTLNIPANYHQNQYRFFQVVENLSVVDNPTLRANRLNTWGKDLLDPAKAGASAIRLEGVGQNAIPMLKNGLTSPHPQVRYFAAEALAYLGDDSGVNVLADAVANRPQFRAYALAALAATDQPSSNLRLRELMSNPDVQVRYGAFNALRTIDPGDPYLGRARVLHDEPAPDPAEDDAMAMQIAAPRRPKKKPSDPFSLFVVDCEGPPLVHVARTRRCEIVIFGKGQTLQTPMVLGAGSILINATDGDTKAQVSRVGSEAIDGPDQKVPTSLALGEIIRETATLGATYPEILSLLQAAERQKNLPGELVVDALPSALEAYDDSQIYGRDVTKDGGVKKTGVEMQRKRKSLLNRILGQ